MSLFIPIYKVNKIPFYSAIYYTFNNINITK